MNSCCYQIFDDYCGRVCMSGMSACAQYPHTGDTRFTVTATIPTTITSYYYLLLLLQTAAAAAATTTTTTVTPPPPPPPQIPLQTPLLLLLYSYYYWCVCVHAVSWASVRVHVRPPSCVLSRYKRRFSLVGNANVVSQVHNIGAVLLVLLQLPPQ